MDDLIPAADRGGILFVSWNLSFLEVTLPDEKPCTSTYALKIK